MIKKCCKRNIQINFLEKIGKPYANLSPPYLHQSAKILRKQLEVQNNKKGAIFAKKLVNAKINNQIGLLKYFAQNQTTNLNKTELRELDSIIDSLKSSKRSLRKIDDKSLNEIRPQLIGLEEKGAKLYWQGVKMLINKKFNFFGRKLKNPRDLVNVSLNYGYGILYSHLWNEVLSNRLNPWAGFLHTDRSGKASFIFDLAEIFRQIVIDFPLISSFINKKFLGGGLNLRKN